MPNVLGKCILSIAYLKCARGEARPGGVLVLLDRQTTHGLVQPTTSYVFVWSGLVQCSVVQARPGGVLLDGEHMAPCYESTRSTVTVNTDSLTLFRP